MTASRSKRGWRAAAFCLAGAALVSLVWMALRFGNPFPPRTVVMATGPQGSAFEDFGKRYRDILERRGVTLQLVETAGGAENLERLRAPDGPVSVAFVENGLTRAAESPQLISLGTVTLEPLWIFFRTRSEGSVGEKLAGKRVSIEPQGSATRVLARKLLEVNGLDESKLELLGLAPARSADALLRGEIDAAILLTPWQSPALQKLLGSSGIWLEGHPRADAYVARYPNLEKVVLPTGVVDLGRNIPPADVPLLAVEASLVVRENIHPTLQYLLLEAAEEVHGGPDIFYRAGRFPAPEAIDLPLGNQARSYYKNGLPFVYRYLPFWMAGLVDRFLILLIPFFTLVFPLLNLLPPLRRYVFERRIYRLYGELKMLETDLERTGRVAPQDVGKQLDRLEERADRLRVPLGYAQRVFILKDHIARVRQQVREPGPLRSR